jgi:hypothetical protein
VIAVLVLCVPVACGGMDTGPQTDYRDVLAQRYPPLKRSLDAAVEPCLADDFPVCGQHYTRALAQARMLLDALDGADVPEGLENADRQFRRGLRALVAVLERTLRATEARDGDEMARLHTEQHVVAVDVNNPLGLFNERLDLDLEPH